MRFLNNVTIKGIIGSAPDTRYTNRGQKIIYILVGVGSDESDKVDWFTVMVIDRSAMNFVESYIKKGSYVYLKGRLKLLYAKNTSNMYRRQIPEMQIVIDKEFPEHTIELARQTVGANIYNN